MAYCSNCGSVLSNPDKCKDCGWEKDMVGMVERCIRCKERPIVPRTSYCPGCHDQLGWETRMKDYLGENNETKSTD